MASRRGFVFRSAGTPATRRASSWGLGTRRRTSRSAPRFRERLRDYALFGDEVSVARAFAHVRHNYELTTRIAWEEFAQLESDRFRRIRLRALLGTGPRVGIVRTDRLESFYGTSYMLEHTQVAETENESDSSGTAHRWSNYVSVSVRPDERIRIDSVSYFQPRFDDFGDYHLLSVNGAEFKVTERLNSRIDVTVRYESVRPTGVKAGDLEFKSSLELTF
jgi:hypothetical protein